jgi:hypothetical protein
LSSVVKSAWEILFFHAAQNAENTLRASENAAALLGQFQFQIEPADRPRWADALWSWLT